MKLSLDELQAFRAVVDTGSITAAAEQLGQTVSGVSRALARLENKLDTTLLRRTTRRIELTEEGRAFLTRACAILAAVDEAEEQMAVRKLQPAGRLRVNAAAPFMLHVLVPMVAAFRHTYPQIELVLDTDDRNIDLLERRTDIAIRIGALDDSTLTARPLGTSRLRVLASPAYLAAHGTPQDIAGLSGHTLLGFTQPEALNRWPLRGAHGDEWFAAPHLSASSGETLRQLALAGNGIVCLSDFMTAGDRASGVLVEVLADIATDICRPISAVYYRNTALSARIVAFLDFIAARMNGGE